MLASTSRPTSIESVLSVGTSGTRLTTSMAWHTKKEARMWYFRDGMENTLGTQFFKRLFPRQSGIIGPKPRSNTRMSVSHPMCLARLRYAGTCTGTYTQVRRPPGLNNVDETKTLWRQLSSNADQLGCVGLKCRISLVRVCYGPLFTVSPRIIFPNTLCMSRPPA